MAKKLVMTLHGINTQGHWQEDIKNVLEPHFKCVSLDYLDYRRFGALKLLFDVALLLVTLVIAGMLVFAPSWVAFAFLPLLFGAWFKALRRRWALVDRIKVQMNQKRKQLVESGAALKNKPHFIGHSLGTFVIGNILKKYQDVSCGRLILTGCVLPAVFNWRDIFDAGRAQSLRNEVGKRDFVAYSAGAMRFAIPGLGNAGFIGFKESKSFIARLRRLRLDADVEFIHDVDQAYGPCLDCPRKIDAGKIHNILIPKFTHSDYFIDQEHALEFWLPTLWGIPPLEFKDFREQCSLATQHQVQNDHDNLVKTIQKLRNMYCSWAGKTLFEYILDCFKGEIERHRMLSAFDIEDLAERAIAQLCRLINRAENLVGSREEGASSQVVFLDPLRAVRLAVKTIANEAMGLPEV